MTVYDKQGRLKHQVFAEFEHLRPGANVRFSLDDKARLYRGRECFCYVDESGIRKGSWGWVVIPMNVIMLDSDCAEVPL